MGPLEGVNVLEFGGIGPAPCCGMMLADMGARVVLLERKQANPNPAPCADPAALGKSAIFHRGKQSIAMDLRKPAAREAALALAADSDILIEGYRPGVMERLGLGPETCLAHNPRLVYGRMTGWGQTGPLAHAAGHDINYIALSGALYHAGHPHDPPMAPPTLVGDLGGGAMLLTVGVLGALYHARLRGEGQVIDAAITDGSALLTTLLYSLHQAGVWSDQRGANIMDGGSHWYNSYRCADGKYITVGALEPEFYDLLVDKCGLAGQAQAGDQLNRERWPELRETFGALFATRSRDEWCALLEGTDACFAPVLDFSEAPRHPHNRARGTFVTLDGLTQPAPAPRLSRTPARIDAPPPERGQHTEAVLQAHGFDAARIAEMRRQGAI